MAENETPAEAEKLQEQLDEHSKKIDAAIKQQEKLGAMGKKALQAAKKVDQLMK